VDLLADGVILCRILEKIHPGKNNFLFFLYFFPSSLSYYLFMILFHKFEKKKGTIDKIRYDGTIFSGGENLTKFLDACSNLGVKHSDLFSVDDVINRNNLRVVQSLGSIREILTPDTPITPFEQTSPKNVSNRKIPAAKSLFSQQIQQQLLQPSQKETQTSDLSKQENESQEKQLNQQQRNQNGPQEKTKEEMKQEQNGRGIQLQKRNSTNSLNQGRISPIQRTRSSSAITRNNNPISEIAELQKGSPNNNNNNNNNNTSRFQRTPRAEGSSRPLSVGSFRQVATSNDNFNKLSRKSSNPEMEKSKTPVLGIKSVKEIQALFESQSPNSKETPTKQFSSNSIEQRRSPPSKPHDIINQIHKPEQAHQQNSPNILEQKNKKIPPIVNIETKPRRSLERQSSKEKEKEEEENELEIQFRKRGLSFEKKGMNKDSRKERQLEREKEREREEKAREEREREKEREIAKQKELEMEIECQKEKEKEIEREKEEVKEEEEKVEEENIQSEETEEIEKVIEDDEKKEEAKEIEEEKKEVEIEREESKESEESEQSVTETKEKNEELEETTSNQESISVEEREKESEDQIAKVENEVDDKEKENEQIDLQESKEKEKETKEDISVEIGIKDEEKEKEEKKTLKEIELVEEVKEEEEDDDDEKEEEEDVKNEEITNEDEEESKNFENRISRSISMEKIKSLTNSIKQLELEQDKIKEEAINNAKEKYVQYSQELQTLCLAHEINEKIMSDSRTSSQATITSWGIKKRPTLTPSRSSSLLKLKSTQEPEPIISHRREKSLDSPIPRFEPISESKRESFTPPESPRFKEVQQGTTAEVLWDYEAMNDDEISLQQFDMITIIRTESDGWWYGESNGRQGWFPSNYVKLGEKKHRPRIESQSLTKYELELKEFNDSWFQKYQEIEKKAPKKKSVTKRDDKDFVKRGNIKWRVDRSHRAKWNDDVDPELVKTLSKEEKGRQEVIFEILKTEKDYIRDLEIIIDVFLRPLRESAILSPKDITVMFSNVEQLLIINQNFLEQLEKRREKSPVLLEIGDLLLVTADVLGKYTMYCSNHPFAVLLYQSIQSKPFKKFVEECSRLPECSKLDIPGYLIKPVQRICRYPLLIREMLKMTGENHVDRANLLLSLEKLESIVAIVNESTPKAEMVSAMVEIQNQFVENINILTQTRRLVRNDYFYVYNTDEEKKFKSKLSSKREFLRELFLFNDLFLMGKPTRDGKLTLMKMCAAEALSFSDMDIVNGYHRFFLLNANSGQAGYVCATHEESVKNEWKTHLKKIREDNVNKTAKRRQKEAEEKGVEEKGTEDTNQLRFSKQKHLQNRLSMIFEKSFDTLESDEDATQMILGFKIEDQLYQDKSDKYYYAIDVTFSCPRLPSQNDLDDESLEIDSLEKEITLTIFKTFEDFVQFHMQLILSFPEEAGRKSNSTRTLPELPVQQMLVTYTMALERVDELTSYLKVFYFYFYFFYQIILTFSLLLFLL